MFHMNNFNLPSPGYKSPITLGSSLTHHRARLAFSLTQQSVDVDGLAVFCGEELSESLESPHSVSCS